jgi:hypothetical protein
MSLFIEKAFSIKVLLNPGRTFKVPNYSTTASFEQQESNGLLNLPLAQASTNAERLLESFIAGGEQRRPRWEFENLYHELIVPLIR